MPQDDKANKEHHVLELVRQATQFDNELRKKYEIGSKFRFIQERLAQLLQQLEASKLDVTQKKAQLDYEAVEDEVLVYVHLFNVHGVKLTSWQNMLNPKLLYEYSVNRPIYTEKKAIDNVIRGKSNQLQHAYITVAVKKTDIISSGEAREGVDNSIVRIKEGSLKFEKFVLFTHNDHHYRVDAEGVISKKEV